MIIDVNLCDVSLIIVCLETMLDTIDEWLAEIENPYSLDIEDFNMWLRGTRYKTDIERVLAKLKVGDLHE